MPPHRLGPHLPGLRQSGESMNCQMTFGIWGLVALPNVDRGALEIGESGQGYLGSGSRTDALTGLNPVLCSDLG